METRLGLAGGAGAAGPTGKILLQGRGGQEVKGSKTARSGSAHAPLPVLMETAVHCMTPAVPGDPGPVTAKLPRISPILWTRISCPTYIPRLRWVLPVNIQPPRSLPWCLSSNSASCPGALPPPGD